MNFKAKIQAKYQLTTASQYEYDTTAEFMLDEKLRVILFVPTYVNRKGEVDVTDFFKNKINFPMAAFNKSDEPEEFDLVYEYGLTPGNDAEVDGANVTLHHAGKEYDLGDLWDKDNLWKWHHDAMYEKAVEDRASSGPEYERD